MIGLIDKTAVRPLPILHRFEGMGEEQPSAPTLSCWELFVVFFKAGLAFGGGPAILAALDRELVERRRTVSREDLLTLYALGRVVPSGTMTAVAVAYGHRFAGLPGTVAALAGLVLPSATLTILLTMTYTMFRDSPVIPLVAATVLPGAVAFIVAAAVRFGRVIFRPSLDLIVAIGSLTAALLGLHPFAIMLGAGLIGMFAFRDGRKS